MRRYATLLVLQLQAVGILIVVRLSLRTKPFQATMARAARVASLIGVRPHTAIRTLNAVRRAGRWVPGSLCLAQSASVAALLQAGGGQPHLVIGCDRSDGAWAAHAWVEADGREYQPVFVTDPTPLARSNAAEGWRPSAVAAA